MGQRAYRGRLVDSLAKNYLNTGLENNSLSNNADYSTSLGTATHNSSQSLQTSGKSEELYYQGKLVDLNLEYDIDNPLQVLGLSESEMNIVLSRGLINAMMPKGSKIKILNLVIKSNLFGLGKTQFHSNLYVLFGSQFIRDIKSIYINLYNPSTGKFFNDRKTISNILDYMCFKTIKLVHMNSSLQYYVIPEYSQFAIVLAYKDVNFYMMEKEFSFQNCLEDLLFHPYCRFERKLENFMRCLGAIERTIPLEVYNIILPVVFFNNLNFEELFGKNTEDNKNSQISNNKLNVNKKIRYLFRDLHEFISEINSRFKIMSLEIKIKFSDEEEDKNQLILNNKICSYNKYQFLDSTPKYLKFVYTVIYENLKFFKNFTFSYLSFEFYNEELEQLNNDKNEINLNNNYNLLSSSLNNNTLPQINFKILEHFRKILIINNLTNLTLSQHISFTKKNRNTNLTDTFDFYDYIHYDKSYADKIWNFILLLKKDEKFSKIFKIKSVLRNVLMSLFDFNKIYKIGRLDYSVEMVKNKKIVPFEVAHNNMMIFSN